ncbi:alpha-mannosidase [Microbacterium keratanolyticum]|nr:glycoside hydrolase family 38 C-terminal domain-containing protein [Microbacterium keratanolyticum]MBM7467977.1 alpha-mannosidase [Microbacterium keratanolyticum]
MSRIGARYMHGSATLTAARVQRFIEERLNAAVYSDARALTLTATVLAGEPLPFAEATRHEFTPFATGTPWGAPWSTMWVRMTGTAPDLREGQRAELVIDLGFTEAQPGFQAEGTVYRPDGTIVKAVEPRNRAVPVHAAPGEALEYYLEAAANPDVAEGFRFRPTVLGDRATAGDAPQYTFRQADVAVREDAVWELLQDARVLLDLTTELDPSSSRHAEILHALDRMVDLMDPDDIVGTVGAGRAALHEVLTRPVAASAHRIHAVGNAHIDSAWLWPVRETQRKVARTFANVLALLDDYPDLTFAASSAQQFLWLKNAQPELFERVRDAVASGNIAPVGGMWVESDTNMPGGEALARQFVRGTRFFVEEFGVQPREVWLPDSFGYSAGLPQIARAAGARWMLTQKMSWNETNRMPHHTFLWEGHDGSRIFTHFPPVDTYSAEMSAAELARAERQHSEKAQSNSSLVPFGYGDGGGGPTREMLAAALRQRSLEGSPAVTLSSPARFFTQAETEYADPPQWQGEMYLEFHRGTYTSQARMKRGNRRSEHLLREAELWAVHATLQGAAYPYDELDAAWETVLLQQFHDILPGTSIAWVHQEAERRYDEVRDSLERIIAQALGVVAGTGTTKLVANAGPYTQYGAAGLGISAALVSTGGSATASRTANGFRLENDHLVVELDEAGLITSLVTRDGGRDAIAPGGRGNLLSVHRDTPTQWDAWDIDEHYRRSVDELRDAISVEVVAASDVCVVREWGATRITQTLRLEPGDHALQIETKVDWRERQKLLKLGFDFDVHADAATSEIQFGHVHRATHANTSWDAARFETVAHRWVHVAEPGYGVAVANDATYGHDISAVPRAGGGRATSVRLSLLRAPTYPDPAADQGEHVFRVSVRPGAQIADAVVEGYRLNVPARRIEGAAPVPRLLTLDHPAVVVEAVKLAEDRSGDVIVRLYEAWGGRADATLSTAFDFSEVRETDLHETTAPAIAITGSEGTLLQLSLRPFQLVTLRFVAPRLH